MIAKTSMQRILVTGAGGFVGPHLVEALRLLCPTAEVLITGHSSGIHPRLGEIAPLDVTSRAACVEIIDDWQPTDVVNLAGFAAPGIAAKNPDLTWAIHLDGPRNLAEAILQRAPDCRLAQIGTGLVYGKPASRDPVAEDALLGPLDDYAASKGAADLALGVYARKGLHCIRLRPFNHSGPGQSEDFVIPAFAMQIARIEAGVAAPLVRVGNLDAERDLLDVADVAEAYARVIATDWRENGEIFNISSCAAVRIGDLLVDLLALSDQNITVEHDPTRNRPSDVPFIAGDSSKFRKAFDWKPRLSLKKTLQRVLDDCRTRIVRNLGGG
jgi:GDP-4-dehydro-6-deoxy-D-mannose reductase